MRLFAKIRAGKDPYYKGLREDQIHALVTERLRKLVEREALFDEIVVEEP
jgi:hypothetical protein